MGGLKEELLKPIWHAFTALDLDRSGKVSKSQLKVGAPRGEAGPGGRRRAAPGAGGPGFRSARSRLPSGRRDAFGPSGLGWAGGREEAGGSERRAPRSSRLGEGGGRAPGSPPGVYP